MINSNSELNFACGATLKNRFMLAPLTNLQSHENGQLSDEEFHWLKMRAEGGFGIVMTCASHVQEVGKGFPGQLGIFSDDLLGGHKKLTTELNRLGSLPVIQLHHAGMRSPESLIEGRPVCPSDNEKTNARGLSLIEVRQLRDDFISSAARAKEAGYSGAEIHGAHGYILAQFLSAEINFRTDEYGGSLENRARLITEIIHGIRLVCGKGFLLGIRFSPERFGMDLNEVKEVCQNLINDGKIDFLDISLWDVFKMPNEEKYQNKSLLAHFSDLDFKSVKWTVAGKISNGHNVQQILDEGVDFVSIGTSAILHHDFPNQVIENPNFSPIELPVTEAHLINEGLSDAFITYLKKWPDFVAKI